MIARTKLLIVLLSASIVIYGFVGGLVSTASIGDDVYRDLSIFMDILHKVQQEYVESPKMDLAVKGALQGMIESLDPYSSYVDGENYRTLSERRRESQASPGLILSKRFGYIYVVSVVPGSSAQRQGLRTADLIESIEGKPTASMSLWEAESLLLGAPDTQVEIRAIRWRRSEATRITLRRSPLTHKAPSAHMLEDGIAVLEIPQFDKGASQTVQSALESLQSQGMRGLIVDVRKTALGELEEAAKTAELFLEKGHLIYSLRHRSQTSLEHRGFAEPKVPSVPVVVLVDRGTSGPAEVFAAALRDHKRGETIGERTNGQGGVQELFRLQDGSALILSIKRVIRSSGQPIQGEGQRDSGVSPDLRWPSQDFESNFYYDNVPEDGDLTELDDDFYRRLADAIEKEQFRKAIEKIRESLLKKDAA